MVKAERKRSEETKKARIVFVHRGPHRLHQNWMRSVGAEPYFFNPKILSKKLPDGRNLPIIKNSLLSQALALLSAFTIPKADIYVIEGIRCLLPTMFRGGKVIMINSDPFFQILERQNWLMKKIYLAYLRRVDAMISTSEMIKKMAEKRTKAPNIVVYPYCHNKYFKENAKIDGKNICTSGRLSKDKGTDILLEEFRSEHRREGRLYLFGSLDGINIDGSEKTIICTGWIDDLEKRLKSCSLYVSNSRFDAFGVGILEAMAEGIPVLVSKNCGIAELLPEELVFTDDEFQKKYKAALNKNFQKKHGRLCKKIALEHTEERSINDFRQAIQRLQRTLLRQ